MLTGGFAFLSYSLFGSYRLLLHFFKNVSVYVDEINAENAAQKARQIMETGVKAKDAIHVACAVIAGADYFLTTDTRLLKYKTDEIKLMNPAEFIIELEG